MIRFVIISPARNEEDNIEKTIQSIINQTLIPHEWIIINDGSTDRTKQIIEKYLPKYPWMRLINLQDRGFYSPGEGVVKTFYEGFRSLKTVDWEFVIKMDCDLSIERDYFNQIFQKFLQNAKLGIASGCIFSFNGNHLEKEKTQSDHPWGACKVYRRACFEDIGGIKPLLGWDLADLLVAQMKGWETRCYGELILVHLRKTGTLRKGITQGKFLHGRIEYRHGYAFYYSFLKGFYHFTEKPYILGGLGIIVGYMYAAFKNEKKIFDDDMIRYLRRRHKEHIMNRIFGRKEI